MPYLYDQLPTNRDLLQNINPSTRFSSYISTAYILSPVKANLTWANQIFYCISDMLWPSDTIIEALVNETL